MAVVVQVREKMSKDEESVSLEEVQVAQLSADPKQAAEDAINKESVSVVSQRELLSASKRRQELLVELEGCKAELERRRAQSAELRGKFKVGNKEVLEC